MKAFSLVRCFLHVLSVFAVVATFAATCAVACQIPGTNLIAHSWRTDLLSSAASWAASVSYSSMSGSDVLSTVNAPVFYRNGQIVWPVLEQAVEALRKRSSVTLESISTIPPSILYFSPWLLYGEDAVEKMKRGAVASAHRTFRDVRRVAKAAASAASGLPPIQPKGNVLINGGCVRIAAGFLPGDVLLLDHPAVKKRSDSDESKNANAGLGSASKHEANKNGNRRREGGKYEDEDLAATILDSLGGGGVSDFLTWDYDAENGVLEIFGVAPFSTMHSIFVTGVRFFPAHSVSVSAAEEFKARRGQRRENADAEIDDANPEVGEDALSEVNQVLAVLPEGQLWRKRLRVTSFTPVVPDDETAKADVNADGDVDAISKRKGTTSLTSTVSSTSTSTSSSSAATYDDLKRFVSIDGVITDVIGDGEAFDDRTTKRKANTAKSEKKANGKTKKKSSKKKRGSSMAKGGSSSSSVSPDAGNSKRENSKVDKSSVESDDPSDDDSPYADPAHAMSTAEFFASIEYNRDRFANGVMDKHGWCLLYPSSPATTDCFVKVTMLFIVLLTKRAIDSQLRKMYDAKRRNQSKKLSTFVPSEALIHTGSDPNKNGNGVDSDGKTTAAATAANAGRRKPNGKRTQATHSPQVAVNNDNSATTHRQHQNDSAEKSTPEAFLELAAVQAGAVSAHGSGGGGNDADSSGAHWQVSFTDVDDAVVDAAAPLELYTLSDHHRRMRRAEFASQQVGDASRQRSHASTPSQSYYSESYSENSSPCPSFTSSPHPSSSVQFPAAQRQKCAHGLSVGRPQTQGQSREVRLDGRDQPSNGSISSSNGAARKVIKPRRKF